MKFAQAPTFTLNSYFLFFRANLPKEGISSPKQDK